MEKRIKTTMIGAIHAIEEVFKNELANSKEFQDKFSEVRTKILDLGNLQIFLYKKDLENEKRSNN